MNENLTIGRIVRLALMQSKFIIFCVLGVLVLSALSYVYSERTYQIKSTIKIDSNFMSRAGDSNLDLFSGNSGSNLTNLVMLYDTRANILETIEELNLNLKFDDIKAQNKFTVNKFKWLKNTKPKSFIFKLVMDKDSFKIFDKDTNIIAEDLPYNKDLENQYFKINISLEDLTEPYNVSATYQRPENLINLYQKKVIVKNMSETPAYFQGSEGMIEISIVSNDVDRGGKILSKLNQVFLREDLKFQNLRATSANSFIDSRLVLIEAELDSKKELLRDFQEINSSLDFDLEVQNIIKTISDLQKQLDQIEIEKAKFTGIYTEENPLYINLLEQEKILLTQKNSIEEQIKTLPYSQQNYLDLFRDFEMTQNIFNQLSDQRLAYSIIEASTISNIRVIDEPYVSNRVTPSFATHFLVIVFSFFISVILGIFRGIYFMPITNPAEIAEEGVNTPIYGVIPFFDEDDDLTQEGKLKSSMESLLMNIEAGAKKKDNSKATRLLFSSPLPSCGKTTTALNFSKLLAHFKYRTLLIDLDLKKGNIHKSLQLNKRPSMDEFMKIDRDSINDFEQSANLFVIPKIKSLNESFALVNSEKFLEKVKELSESFDYIIFDTAPLLSVADTGLLMSISDMNFLLVRHAQTKLNEIKQTTSIVDQLGVGFDGIIYNAYKKPNSYYGYYGLYGNYNYQYYAEKYLSYKYEYNEKK